MCVAWVMLSRDEVVNNRAFYFGISYIAEFRMTVNNILQFLNWEFNHAKAKLLEYFKAIESKFSPISQIIDFPRL